MSWAHLKPAIEQGATIVTANVRVARQIDRWYGRQQKAKAWSRPDILPWRAWLERLWQDAAFAANSQPLLRLNEWQRQCLWERIISQSPAGPKLFSAAAIAEPAQRAYTLLQDYCVPGDAKLRATSDSSAFADWKRTYDRTCADNAWTDASRIAAVLTDKPQPLASAQEIVLVGFDQMTPQQQTLLRALEAQGCRVSTVDPSQQNHSAHRVALPDTMAEMHFAACWARQRLGDEPDATIGIIVPALSNVRERIERVFLEVLHPEALLSGSERRAFDISLGRSLYDYPLVRCAIALLSWAAGRISIGEAGFVLRSPFLKGAETEGSRRALLDAHMRRKSGPQVSTADVRKFAGELNDRGAPAAYNCPRLSYLLSAGSAAIKTQAKSPSAWRETFSDVLEAFGWPGDRSLDSVEYQTLEGWQDLLRDLATLDEIERTWSAAEALRRIEQFARDRIFQPENTGAPIQIMGAMEAAGSVFDHLWVMGLEEGQWPPHGSPNPLLPLSLQREYGMPHASADADFAWANRITRRLLSSADEVVLSHPCAEQDRALRHSPLIAQVALANVTQLIGDHSSWTDSIPAAQLVAIDDTSSLQLASEDLQRGGTRVLKLQSACPFQAFGSIRLSAKALDWPSEGLDALDRGSLVHNLLQFLWDDLKSRRTLSTLPAVELQQVIASCVDRAIQKDHIFQRDDWMRRFAGLERQRLSALAGEWLAIEKQRADFEVLVTEKKSLVEIGGVFIEARIDRVDQLADGRRVVIDYKTGIPVKDTAWEGPRPDEPQLPLYATTIDGAVAGVVFAHVRSGESRFKGLASPAASIHGAKRKSDDELRDQVEQWREVVNQLGADFRNGLRVIDPKFPGKTCRTCDLPGLCRIEEITNVPLNGSEEAVDD